MFSRRGEKRRELWRGRAGNANRRERLLSAVRVNWRAGPARCGSKGSANDPYITPISPAWRESVCCKCLLDGFLGEPSRRERKGAKRSDASGFRGATRARQGAILASLWERKGAIGSDHGRLEAVIAPCRSRTSRATTGPRQPLGSSG